MQETFGKSSVAAFARFAVLAIGAAPLLAGCLGGVMSSASGFINQETKFSSSEYGVAASPRLTTSKTTKKGGGRYQVGKPYKVAGKWYTPKVQPKYDKTGAASWYGPNFHGRQTANGEIFDQNAISAAHPTLPLPSYVRVTNLANNNSIMVRVNDRGPFAAGREIDLSKRAAEMLGYTNAGIARVRVKYVGRAPLEGDDTRMLLASYNNPSRVERGTSSDTRIAFAEPQSQSIFNQVFAQPKVQTPQRQSATRLTSQGFNLVGQSTERVLGPLFYAPKKSNKELNTLISSAFDATNALAQNNPDLIKWQQSYNDHGMLLNLELGIFANANGAQRVMDVFSTIGAVEQQLISISKGPAAKLTLTYLKPGVSITDVRDRATELGLKDIILY